MLKAILVKILVEGKRARGRQECRWEDNIRDIAGHSQAKCTIKARERGNEILRAAHDDANDELMHIKPRDSHALN